MRVTLDTGTWGFLNFATIYKFTRYLLSAYSVSGTFPGQGCHTELHAAQPSGGANHMVDTVHDMTGCWECRGKQDQPGLWSHRGWSPTGSQSGKAGMTLQYGQGGDGGGAGAVGTCRRGPKLYLVSQRRLPGRSDI